MSRPFIILNPATFKKMYIDDNTPLVAIAQHFGVSIGTIQKNRHYLNLPLRNKRVMYDENEFRRLFELGVNYDTMAEKLSMSRCSVIVIRQQLGLPARNQRKEKVPE
ncbi:MAG: hypothetical protein ACYDEF_09490 [Methanosarcina sp.]